MNDLTIQHNHGIYQLTNCVFTPYGDKGCRKVTGTVVKGHITSRLFSHSSTEHLVQGSELTVDLYTREIYTNSDGTNRVDITFCG